MDSDKILALAREARIAHIGVEVSLVKFAALLQQQMIKDGWGSPEQVKKAVEDERDACAAYAAVEWGEIDIAEGIRSRSNHE